MEAPEMQLSIVPEVVLTKEGTALFSVILAINY